MTFPLPNGTEPEKPVVATSVDGTTVSMTPDELRVKLATLQTVRGQQTFMPFPAPKKHLATQTEFPKRTAIRAGVATVVLFLVAAAAGSPIIGPFIDRYIPGAGAGVLAFGVFCGLLVGLLNRLANLKPVAQLLTRLGLGPVPKS